MNVISEAIANLSSSPVVPHTGQPGNGSGTASGFALKLAAAQASSLPSSAGGVEGTASFSFRSATLSAAKLSGAIASPQSKKLAGGSLETNLVALPVAAAAAALPEQPVAPPASLPPSVPAGNLIAVPSAALSSSLTAPVGQSASALDGANFGGSVSPPLTAPSAPLAGPDLLPANLQSNPPRSGQSDPVPGADSELDTSELEASEMGTSETVIGAGGGAPPSTLAAAPSSPAQAISPLRLLASAAGEPQGVPWNRQNATSSEGAAQAVQTGAALENRFSSIAGAANSNDVSADVANAASTAIGLAQNPAATFSIPQPVKLPAPAAIQKGNGPVTVPTGRSAIAASPAVEASSENWSTTVTAASQTPFALYFSSPGAGTESAASVLPKMILPAANTALHNIPNSARSSFATVTANAGTSAGSAAQTASPAGNVQAASVQAGLSLRHGPQPDLSNVGDSAPGSAIPPSPSAAAQTSAAVSPLGGQASATAPVVAALVPPQAQPAAPDSSLKPNLPGAGGAPANPPSANPQVLPTPVPGPVQVAQMVNRVGQSEMRIGMTTSSFGSVEVRTVVHASDVGLLIASEKGDLRGLLSNEMPALASSLQQQNLRLNTVNFMQGTAFSNNMSGGGDSQQRSFVPQPSPARFGDHSSEVPGNEAVENQAAQSAWAGGSLSILA